MPMTSSKVKMPIVIVGAGMAGLAAAHHLKARGRQAFILEAADRVGGRMTSDTVGGHVVDRGAQFLSTEYRLIPEMLRDLDLAHDICEASQCSAIVRDGKPLLLRAGHALDLIRFLGFPSALNFAWKMLNLKQRTKTLSLSDYSQWAEFDIESTSAWCNRELGASITEYVYEPVLQGFYFQSPEEASGALMAALSTFGMRRAKTLSLNAGLGQLPEALAKNLDVRLGTPVLSIECANDGVLVHTVRETLEAQRVIAAVPAVVAQKLIAYPLNDEMRALLSTPYSASINVACVTDAMFGLPKNLSNVYGLLIPRKERTCAAAVGIESNKRNTYGALGNQLNIMLSHEAAVDLMNAPDVDILESAVRSVCGYFPNLAAHITQSRVYRWPAAEPRSSVGRASMLRTYRQKSSKEKPRIILAGDYMSMPFTEGAVESGYWAANLVGQASNPSFHRTCYSGPRPLPHAGELKR